MTLAINGVVRRDDFMVEVDLVVPAGGHVVITGENGAGKSTVLHAIAGLVDFDGDLAVNGASWSALPAAERRCGVVFQDIRLFDHFRVAQNVAYGLRARGASAHRAHHEASAWLERIEISHLADRFPPELSGGERQRVAIARALATQPQVLLLDEPLSAIDRATRPAIARLIRECLAEFQGSALIVLHDTDEFDVPGIPHLVCQDGRVR